MMCIALPKDTHLNYQLFTLNRPSFAEQSSAFTEGSVSFSHFYAHA